MTQTWALTAAIFVLGLLLGYFARTLTSDIRDLADLQAELDEVTEKAEAFEKAAALEKAAAQSHAQVGRTEAAILKNLERNARR